MFANRDTVRIDSVGEGQCFAKFEDFEGLTTSWVEESDCDEPHALEIYEVSNAFLSPAVLYPHLTEEQVDLIYCTDALERIVGTTYDKSDLEVWMIRPSENTPNRLGGPKIICAAGQSNGGMSVGSLGARNSHPESKIDLNDSGSTRTLPEGGLTHAQP